MRVRFPISRLATGCLCLMGIVNGQVAVQITMDSTYQTIACLGSMINNGTGQGNSGQEISDVKVSGYRIFFDAQYNHDLEPQNDNGDPNSLDLSKFVHNSVYLNTAKQAKAAGQRVAAANRKPHIDKVFEILKALPDMTVFANEAELDDYLAAMQERARGE